MAFFNHTPSIIYWYKYFITTLCNSRKKKLAYFLKSCNNCVCFLVINYKTWFEVVRPFIIIINL